MWQRLEYQDDNDKDDDRVVYSMMMIRNVRRWAEQYDHAREEAGDTNH
jgi:hypothetical protein